MNGEGARGLIDSGCSRTILGPGVKIHNRFYSPCNSFILGFDGSQVPVAGEAQVELSFAGKPVVVRALVSRRLLPGVNVIVGLDVLKHHRVVLDRGSIVAASAATPKPKKSRAPNSEWVIQDRDFVVRFNGKYWTAKCDWMAEPVLTKSVGQYAVSPEMVEEFERGVERRITEGWLVLRKKRGQCGRRPTVPLMAVLQAAKGKVRPVLDYREVNEFVSASGANADVCAEKLRAWWKFPPTVR